MSMESAPAQAASVSGKCWPMSPSPAAPSSASVTAWATTSASLWPARPGPSGKVTPPSTRGRAGSSEKGWTSKPCPTRITAAGAGSPGTEQGLGHDQVGRVRDLEVEGRAVHDDHLATRRLHERCVVGGLRRALVRGAEDRGPEGLGRLHRHQAVPVGDPARTPAQRVGQRDAGHRGIGPRPHRSHHRAEQVAPGQGPRAVVHDHHGRVRGDTRQPGPHRGRAGVAAARHRIGLRLARIHDRGREHDHDPVRHGAGSVERPVEHPAAAQRLELLGSAEPAARSGRHHDGPHRSHDRPEATAIDPRESPFDDLGSWHRYRLPVMTPADLLADVDLFGDLTPDERQQLADASTTEELRRGDVLFHEDDEADTLYVVIEGRIAIAKRSIDGRESVVALMEAGDLFGEMPLFEPLGRSAEARALEPSQVLAIGYGPVRDVYQRRPELLWGVVELMAGRIRNMDVALADSVFLDVTGRTAKRLVEMASGADEFTLPVTQEELAAMVGASRERVNKAIASFVRLGWIEQSERRYRITDREQLERRAR